MLEKKTCETIGKSFPKSLSLLLFFSEKYCLSRYVLLFKNHCRLRKFENRIFSLA